MALSTKDIAALGIVAGHEAKREEEEEEEDRKM